MMTITSIMRVILGCCLSVASSQPITSRIYQRLLYLLTNQIAHQGFWIFNWLKLSLDSEDGFRTGCRNVSHQQQSFEFSGLQSPRWSFSIKVCYSWVQKYLDLYQKKRKKMRSERSVFLGKPNTSIALLNRNLSQKTRTNSSLRECDNCMRCYYTQNTFSALWSVFHLSLFRSFSWIWHAG